jgi:SPP1 family predicted phage head-tail adaptor
MQSGDLSHRITIEASTRVSDGGGGFNTVWIALPQLTNIAASKWPVKGSEAFEGGRTVAIADYRFRIRYRRTFKTAWRIKDLFTGKYMSIVSTPIDVGNSHQFLEFLAKEVTS